MRVNLKLKSLRHFLVLLVCVSGGPIGCGDSVTLLGDASVRSVDSDLQVDAYDLKPVCVGNMERPTIQFEIPVKTRNREAHSKGELLTLVGQDSWVAYTSWIISSGRQTVDTYRTAFIDVEDARDGGVHVSIRSLKPGRFDSQIEVGAMVNYRPVEFALREVGDTHWRTTHGTYIPNDDGFLLFDVHLPNEAFDPGYNDLVLFFRSRFAGRDRFHMRRINVLKGTAKMNLPLSAREYCLEGALDSTPSRVELEAAYRRNDLPLFSSKASRASEPWNVIEAEPGEPLTLFYPHFRRFFGRVEMAAVLIKDGVPAAAPRFLVDASNSENELGQAVVDARIAFEITAPSEPGHYRYSVMALPKPFMPTEIAYERFGDGELGVNLITSDSVFVNVARKKP